MTARVRYGVAGFAGALSAFLLVVGVEALGYYFYPPPPGLDFKNAEQVRVHVEGLPSGAFFVVLAAWFLATLVGGLVACRIARTRPMHFAGIIGVLVLAGAIANLFMLPHPVWFTVAALVGIPVFAFLAARLASKSAPQ